MSTKVVTSDTTPYLSKLISFESERNVYIYGKLCLPRISTRLGLVLFHGGKAGSSKRFNFLQPALAKNGIASLAIDFRGKGKSSEIYERSTLNDRLVDAKAAINFFTNYLKQVRIGILGVSLAGDTVRLLKELSAVKTILLIGPVAVSDNLTNMFPPHKAYGLSKKTNSWKESTVFSLLKNFKGSKLIIYGDKENIATPEIIEDFKRAVVDSGQFVILKNAGHNPFLVDKKATEEIRKEQTVSRQKTINILIRFLRKHF